ncbi:MAG: carbohydrate ABC transporter substrate-binding protein [Clostridiales bacterium]|nr:carbohydrate ABC transporter substrate-binding protein [Clostridiales bacterium]
MKKKLLSLIFVMVMIASLLAACGKADDETAADDKNTADEGKVLNIWCWNDEFQSRVKDFYPGYEHNDSTGEGKIGDITVKWVITPNENNAYQNALDAALLDQKNKAADDNVDIFLIEADYALKYTDSDYTMDVKKVGLTDADMSEQYQYTKDIVTANGKIKGSTWQATPGLFVYRRSIANEVLGTDDPAEVQKKLADWNKFNAVAADMKASGYTMLAGYDDSYRTFSNNVSGPWVQGGKVVVDDNIMRWVDQTKEFTDKGYNKKTTLWAPEWAAEQGPEGTTFGFFYSTWGINFTLLDNSLADAKAAKEVGNGIYGDWAVCQGPESYYWGGTWICAATGTDNVSAIKDIMLKLTCDKAIMKKITEVTQDYTNHKAAMNELANSDFQSDFLGGQNHIALFAEAAPKIDMSNISPYDQGCNEEFQGAFKDYFDGNVSKEEALQNFYTNIKVKYPELTTN